MSITAAFDKFGAITAAIDGQVMTVPNDPTNRHRQMLADWEAKGHEIELYVAPPPLHDDLFAERDRRLALGFDYDFGDARGVHRVNTTPADMLGWDEVTKLAQALINVGQPKQAITIATGTGLAQVTAMEWQSVLLAAAGLRQLVWSRSFALGAMDPIPADFTDDKYWS